MITKSDLIAVLMGGPGSEHDVSIASGNAVVKALSDAGYNAVPVIVNGTDFTLPEGTFIACNMIHGTFGEDGQLQDKLEALGIPYTGARAKSSRLAFDKILAKQEFVRHGVPTPKSVVLDCSNGPVLPPFPTPFVVKPPREGSSFGVSIVTNPDDALEAIRKAASHSPDVLVEEFIQGKELTVPILNGEALPVIHIAPRSGFYDVANKYPWMGGQGGSDYYCPADISPELTRKVQEAAIAAHNALGVEVYSRVDVLLTEDGHPYVLESNTIPGMTATSLFPKSAAVVGISFPELCLKIVELSLRASRASH